MAKKIIVYGTSWCPHCNEAREFFKEKGIEVEDVDVEKEPEKAREMVEKTGQMGVPVIVIGKDVVVGFDREEVEKLLK